MCGSPDIPHLDAGWLATLKVRCCNIWQQKNCPSCPLHSLTLGTDIQHLVALGFQQCYSWRRQLWHYWQGTSHQYWWTCPASSSRWTSVDSSAFFLFCPRRAPHLPSSAYAYFPPCPEVKLPCRNAVNTIQCSLLAYEKLRLCTWLSEDKEHQWPRIPWNFFKTSHESAKVL